MVLPSSRCLLQWHLLAVLVIFDCLCFLFIFSIASPATNKEMQQRNIAVAKNVIMYMGRELGCPLQMYTGFHTP